MKRRQRERERGRGEKEEEKEGDETRRDETRRDETRRDERRGEIQDRTPTTGHAVHLPRPPPGKYKGPASYENIAGMYI